MCLRTWTKPRTLSLTFLGSRAECSQVGQVLSAESWCVWGEGDVSSGRGWPHRQLAAWLRALGAVGPARTELWGWAPWGWRPPLGDAGMGQGGRLHRGQA